MKRKEKISLILLLFCIITYQSNSQQVVITLDQPEYGTIEHVASEKIHFLPGYSYSPGYSVFGNMSMHAYIDQNQIYPVNYLSQAPNAQNRVLDYSLPVGSLPGNATVSLSGAANYSIPIEVPPGTNGMQPNLSVNYNSQAGNGILGVKWQLGGLSAITRVPRDIYHDGQVRGIQFNDDDKFSLDGNRLVIVGNSINYGANGTQYHTELETYSLITLTSTTGVGATSFIVQTKDGNIIEYGVSEDSRIEAEGRPEVLVWLMNKVTDPFGNCMEYFYHESNGQGEFRIDRIEYTKNALNGIPNHYNKVQFYYDERTDKSLAYINGSYQKNTKLIRKISTFCEGDLVYEYRFNYHFDFSSRLVEVEKLASDNSHVNSTIFEWGEDGFETYLEPQSYGISPGLKVCADFNNDGKAEMLNVLYDGNSEITQNWELCKIEPTGYTIISSGSSFPEEIECLIPGDFNGDGRLDLLAPWKDDQLNQTFISLLLNVGGTFVLQNQSISYHSSVEQKFKVGDFNGDGKDDVFRMHETGSNSKCMIWEYDFVTGSLDFMASYITDHPEYIRIADFTGDGRDDFLFVTNGSTSLRSYLGSNYLYEISSLTYPDKFHHVFTGDFNGDGRCDILSHKNGIWKIGLCDGNLFTSWIMDAPPISNLSFPSYNPWDDNYFIFDYNGDGKSDIMEGIITGTGTHSKTLYYHNGSDWIVESENYNYAAAYIESDYFSDFNGDGSIDLIEPIGVGQFGLRYFHPFDERQLIKFISNGLDVKTQIEYETLANDEVYSIGSGGIFPLIDIIAPINTVSEIRVENGVGSMNIEEYSYAGAKFHKQGRGFLGFTSIVTSSLNTGLQKTTVNEFNLSRYLPNIAYTKTELNTFPIELLSESYVETSIIDFQNVFNCNSFIPLETEITSNNPLKETSKVSTFTYDLYGNVLTKTDKLYNGITAEWEEVISYNNYSQAGAFYPNKPESIIRSLNNLSVSGDFVKQTNYTYNSMNGVIVSVNTNPSTSHQLSLVNEYNSFGNLISETAVAPGQNDRINSYIYDDKGRFVISKTNPEGHVQLSEYNNSNGKVLNQTDPNDLLTSYEYNSLGSVTKKIMSSGHEELYSSEWYTGSLSNIHYVYSIYTAGSGPKVKYLNKTGLSQRAEYPSFNSTLVEDIVYNSSGLILQKSLPYELGTNPEWITYTYGGKGELLSESSPTNSYSYYYNGLTTTKTESNLSVSSSSTRDAAGNIVSINDIHSNIIDYDFSNQGLNVGIIINNDPSTEITMEYDILGNQILLSDPNTGNISYSYNAYGELLNQTDANNNEYNFVYDKLGREVLSYSPSGETTTYTYDNANNGIGLISNINYNNSISRTFQYDNYARLSSISESIDGANYTYGYTYNSFNQISTETFPSGFSIENVYNNNGFIEEIQENNGSLLWECVNVDANGSVSQFNLGNGYSTLKQFDVSGYLSSIETFDQNMDNVQDLYYDFSSITGNLETRADLKNTLTENFGYDVSKTKLVSSQVGASVPMVYNYDNLGNLISKSDAGNYTYDQVKINAVNGVSGNPNTIPSFNQTITYTDFGKVATITENDYTLTFYYGHDRLRRKTQLTQNSVLIKTKYFMGNYEKEINETTGEVKEYHYLNSPSGTFAVITKISGQPDDIRYIHSDHLGSIQSISDNNGTLIQEYSYDAWGRQRNSDYWSYNNVSDLPDFKRGYTGHEHLPEFGLINMNGRLYDPILGRMLSPDNFIQCPGNSQNYNRYSYCMNNPLKYTDPSGEVYLIDDLIVGGIGFLYGYISHGVLNDDWGWSAVGAGALGSATFLFGYYSGGITSQGSIASVFSNAGLNGSANTVALSYSGRMMGSIAISSMLPDVSVQLGEMRIGLSPSFIFGSGGFKVGVNFITQVNIDGFTFGSCIGADYGKSIHTGMINLEYRFSGMFGFDNGKFGMQLSTTQFESGETSQTVGNIFARYSDASLSYGNDGLPFDKIGLAGGTDSYRTASATIGYKDFTIGMLLFTGHRDETSLDKSDPQQYPYGMVGNSEINKYNSGILYFGHNNMRFGWNHDNVRHVFQNKFAHGFITNQAWIPRKNWPNQPYIVYGSNNPYTSW